MYDAIVIGARCAGSPTAMLLARHHFEEIWNQGKLDLIDTYFAPDFLNFGHPCPPERVRQIVLAWRTAFPDLQFTIEEQIVEADQVFSRCTCSGTHLGPFVHPLVGSLPPTGQALRGTADASYSLARRSAGGTLGCAG